MTDPSERENRGKTSLTVIVPAYNEQYLVEASLRRLFVLGESPLLERVQVIVVDDASVDETPAAIERFKQSLASSPAPGRIEWKFLRHEQNLGKGAAVRTALEHADAELTVIHDADLEYHPADLLQIAALFLNEDADAVYGSRFLPGQFKRALFFRHALGNNLLTFLSNLVSDLYLTDMETCYKMVRTRLLKSIPLESRDFRIEPELTIKLAKREARVFEVPIRYSGRTYQEGKKINWRDGVLALLAVVRYAISDNIYVEDEYGSQILVRLSRAPRFTRWMADTVRPYVGDRVLEVGAGTGTMTVNLIPRKHYRATDVNPLYLDALRGLRRTRPYLEVAALDAADPHSFPRDQTFDTVICINVLEHLADDLAVLQSIRSVLAPGGRAIILVPRGPALFGSLDAILGHQRRYTEPQLVALGQRGGFKLVKMLRFNRPGVPGWWLNGKLLRRKNVGLLQIKLFNLLVPLFRLVDSWLPLPPLSLIAIFEKE